ncbi:MAG: DUF1003 domain-containing protein [Syntrophomonadaceae bacterium]
MSPIAEKGPAASYKHGHPPVRNVNEEYQKGLTLGQRVADKIAAGVGSWPFIITQSLMIVVWMAINVYLAIMIKTHPDYIKAWDPYPFILLNLVLSLQAAYTGPVVMMSQNRQSDKDRIAAQHDYEINIKSEEEIKLIINQLAYQDEMIQHIISHLEQLNSPPTPAQEAN